MITLSPEHRSTISALREALKTKQPDAIRAAMRASREQHGDDVHEQLKGRALFAVAAGR